MMSSTTEPHSFDNPSLIYDAISSTRRRRILDILSEIDQSVTVRDLARETVRREQAESAQMVESEQIDTVHISLHHHHLPKLDELGLVEYKISEDRVETVEEAPLEEIAAFE